MEHIRTRTYKVPSLQLAVRLAASALNGNVPSLSGLVERRCSDLGRSPDVKVQAVSIPGSNERDEPSASTATVRQARRECLRVKPISNLASRSVDGPFLRERDVLNNRSERSSVSRRSCKESTANGQVVCDKLDQWLPPGCVDKGQAHLARRGSGG